MENFLQSNPEINAVFTINDPSAVGALAAIEAAKRTDIKIYSIDGSQDAIKLIKDNKIVGTSAQFPVKMGQTAGDLVYKVINGEKFEKIGQSGKRIHRSIELSAVLEIRNGARRR